MNRTQIAAWNRIIESYAAYNSSYDSVGRYVAMWDLETAIESSATVIDYEEIEITGIMEIGS